MTNIIISSPSNKNRRPPSFVTLTAKRLDARAACCSRTALARLDGEAFRRSLRALPLKMPPRQNAEHDQTETFSLFNRKSFSENLASQERLA